MALLSLALACCAFGAVDKREEVVTREPPPPVSVGAVLPAPRGGSYVIAYSEPTSSRGIRDGGTLIMLRYDRRGRRVRSFGRRGSYRTSLPGRPIRVQGALRQRDGKLVVVGSIGRGDAQDLLVARFYPDGTLDGAFGTGGMQTVDFGGWGDFAVDVDVQPDGALVVAGSTLSDRPYPSSPLEEMVLLRLRSDGSVDETFATGGVRRFPPREPYHGYEQAAAVVVAPDGAILLGGTTRSNFRPDTGYWPVIERVSPDGSESARIDVSGSVAELAEMVLDRASGRLYLAGSQSRDDFGDAHMWVAALREDLSLDPSFGTEGAAVADFPRTVSDRVAAVIRDRRGRIVVAGSAARFAPDRSSFALARFTPRGRLDRTFGRRGRAVVRFGDASASQALMEHPRGRLVAAGVSGLATTYWTFGRTVAIARLRNGR